MLLSAWMLSRIEGRRAGLGRAVGERATVYWCVYRRLEEPFEAFEGKEDEELVEDRRV